MKYLKIILILIIMAPAAYWANRTVKREACFLELQQMKRYEEETYRYQHKQCVFFESEKCMEQLAKWSEKEMNAISRKIDECYAL